MDALPDTIYTAIGVVVAAVISGWYGAKRGAGRMGEMERHLLDQLVEIQNRLHAVTDLWDECEKSKSVMGERMDILQRRLNKLEEECRQCQRKGA